MSMHSPLEILTKYWGFNSFLSSQEEIINEVLSGRDTLALLPTGGGKSICFQVPSIMVDGICLVVSPLIGLIKDQVSSLQAKGIKAMAITSGMTLSEVDIALDNCIYGNFKFLYLSPERLQNKMVHERLKKMQINLIAIDEAHCISEWGYDFRPAYLKIAEIRSFIEAPLLALTATATPEVVEDIQKKLLFKESNVWHKSFLRSNLSFVVLEQEDKDGKLLRVLQRVKGSCIVYCNTRKETKRIYQLLQEHNISAHFYHGGLDIVDRDTKQKQWQQNHVRVMVATNAFGMGIDKHNVRLVVHMHLPSSPEAYFQEAGRAGRDKKIAYAILITNGFDISHLKKNIDEHYPPLKEIMNVYQHLANHLQIAIGSSQGKGFEFHLEEFCNKYKLHHLKTFNTLKLLEREGYLKLIDAVRQPSRIHFKMKHGEIYQFQIGNPLYDPLVKTILRSYGNVFDSFTKIQESILAKRSGLTTNEVKYYLQKLNNMNVLEYLPQNSTPKIFFTMARVDAKMLSISKETLVKRKTIEQRKAATMISYVKNQYRCRSSFLLNYFGEENQIRCKICDVCLERNRLDISDSEFEKIAKSIENLITENPLSTDDIILKIVEFREDKMIHVIQFLHDNGQLEFTEDEKLIWKR